MTADPFAAPQPPLADSVRILPDDVLEIFGVRYSGALFREIAFAPIGTRLQIIARGDGTVTFRHFYDGGGDHG